MEQEELDQLLQVMENPIRRKIIKRLSQGPTYAFQLAKELGLGQPLVAKHMKVMEDAGFVSSETEISPSGPRRKRYSLTKSVSISMDLAPNTYVERGMVLKARSKRKIESQATNKLRKRVSNALAVEGEKERLSQLSEILGEVDARMNSLESEHAGLIDIRSQAMQAASEIANRLDAFDTRRVLFHILDEHDMEAASISEALELREASVREILQELEREFFG